MARRVPVSVFCGVAILPIPTAVCTTSWPPAVEGLSVLFQRDTELAGKHRPLMLASREGP